MYGSGTEKVAEKQKTVKDVGSRALCCGKRLDWEQGHAGSRVSLSALPNHAWPRVGPLKPGDLRFLAPVKELGPEASEIPPACTLLPGLLSSPVVCTASQCCQRDSSLFCIY